MSFDEVKAQQSRIDELEKQLAICQLHNKQLVKALKGLRDNLDEEGYSTQLQMCLSRADRLIDTPPDTSALDAYVESKRCQPLQK